MRAFRVDYRPVHNRNPSTTPPGTQERWRGSVTSTKSRLPNCGRAPRREVRPAPHQDRGRDSGCIPRSDMAHCDAAGVNRGNRELSHGAPQPRMMPNGCLGNPVLVLPRSGRGAPHGCRTDARKALGLRCGPSGAGEQTVDFLRQRDAVLPLVRGQLVQLRRLEQPRQLRVTRHAPTTCDRRSRAALGSRSSASLQAAKSARNHCRACCRQRARSGSPTPATSSPRALPTRAAARAALKRRADW
jgi:hypothetical protein